MSERGILALWRFTTRHCHKVNASSMGGKMSVTRLLGMKMMRNVMTMNDISIIGA